MCVGILPASRECNMCMIVLQSLDPLELELGVVVSHLHGAATQSPLS